MNSMQQKKPTFKDQFKDTADRSNIVDSIKISTLIMHLRQNQMAKSTIIPPTIVLERNDTNNVSTTFTSQIKQSKKRRHSNTLEAIHKSPEKNRRVARPCFYCDLDVKNWRRHLETQHKNEDLVKSTVGLPLLEKRRMFQVLKRLGIAKNDETSQSNKLNKKKHFLQCKNCKGYFAKKNLHRHRKYKYCAIYTKENIKNSSILGNENQDFIEDVLNKLKEDEIGNNIKQDILLQHFAKYLYTNKVLNKGVCARIDTRKISGLFEEFKKNPDHINLTAIDMLRPKNFKELEIALVANSPAHNLRLSIGFLLKKLAKVGIALSQGNNDLQTVSDVEAFKKLLELNWKRLFKGSQIKQLLVRAERLRHPAAMPNEKEVLKLRNFCTNEIAVFDNLESLTLRQFWYLRDLVLTRLTAYNARRGGEPARLKIKETEEGLAGCWLENAALEIVEEKDRHLLDEIILLYQTGNRQKELVPVLVPRACIKAILLLIKERNNYTDPNNMYVFPSTGETTQHVNGYDAMQKIIKKAGITIKLTANKFRHRASTIFASKYKTKKEEKSFYKQIEQSQQINENVDQASSWYHEIIKVGEFFEQLDNCNDNIRDTSLNQEMQTSTSHNNESKNTSLNQERQMSTSHNNESKSKMEIQSFKGSNIKSRNIRWKKIKNRIYEPIITGLWMMKQKQLDEEGLVFNCQSCFCYFENRLSYDIHMHGLKHIKMDYLSKLTGSSMRKQQAYSEVDKKLLTLTDPILGMDYVTEYRHSNGKTDYFCFLCNEWISSSSVVGEHLLSEKHYMTYMFHNDNYAYTEALKSDYHFPTIKRLASQIEANCQSRQWLIRVKTQIDGKWMDLTNANCRPCSALRGHYLSCEYDCGIPLSTDPCSSFSIFLQKYSFIMRAGNQYLPPNQIPTTSTSSFLDSLMDVKIKKSRDAEVCLQLANALTTALLKFRLSTIAKLDKIDSSVLKEKLTNLLLDAEAVTNKTILSETN